MQYVSQKLDRAVYEFTKKSSSVRRRALIFLSDVCSLSSSIRSTSTNGGQEDTPIRQDLKWCDCKRIGQGMRILKIYEIFGVSNIHKGVTNLLLTSDSLATSHPLSHGLWYDRGREEKLSAEMRTNSKDTASCHRLACETSIQDLVGIWMLAARIALADFSISSWWGNYGPHNVFR